MDDRNNSSVLVTGGRGFIGRAVVSLLRRAGYRVSSLDQSGVDRGGEMGDVVCDISDAAQLQRVFEAERIGAIIHLAAILPTATQREPLRATQVNVVGSLNLMELAHEFRVARIVFGSSVSVYGTCPDGRIMSEQDRAAPEDVYGAAKLYVEQVGDTYRGSGFEFVSLRIARVVGPGAQSVTSAWRSQIFERLGATEAAEIDLPYLMSERVLLVHIDDVAQMLVTLLQAPQLRHAVYNALCESIVVDDLKRAVEGLNPNVCVRLGGARVVGNPRLLDCGRFAEEFGFRAAPILERLRLERFHR
jgi:UDP-glucose 4-epimerase